MAGWISRMHGRRRMRGFGKRVSAKLAPRRARDPPPPASLLRASTAFDRIPPAAVASFRGTVGRVLGSARAASRLVSRQAHVPRSLTLQHYTFLDIHGQSLLLFALKSISLFILKFEKQNIVYVNAKPWDYII